jgi:hypothetical protein
VFQKAVVIGLGVVALALPAVSQAQTLSTYGDVQIVKPGDGSNPSAFQLTSSPSGAGYAGLADQFTSPVPLDQITTLEADYQMTTGTFGGGAPRFSIIDTTSNAANEAYVYWGTPTAGGSFSDPNAGSGWANTGDLATSPDLRVQVNGFGGVNTGYGYISWSQFLIDAGKVDVGFVTIDLDGGFSDPGQQMLVNDFTVNNSVFNPGVPEPTIWSMLILGVAALGTALRMRPKRLALA